MDTKISQSNTQFIPNTVLTAADLNSVVTKLNEVIGNQQDSESASLYSVWTQIESMLTDIENLQYPAEGRENGLEDEEEGQPSLIDQLKTLYLLDNDGNPIVTSVDVDAIRTNTSNVASLQSGKVDKTGLIAAINASEENLTIDSSKLSITVDPNNSQSVIDITAQLQTLGLIDSNSNPVVTPADVTAIGTNATNITTLQSGKVDKTGVIAAINASSESATISADKLPAISINNVIVQIAPNTIAARVNYASSRIYFPHPQAGLLFIVIHTGAIASTFYAYDPTDSYYAEGIAFERDENYTDTLDTLPCLFPMVNRQYRLAAPYSATSRGSSRTFSGNYEVDSYGADQMYFQNAFDMWVCDGRDWWSLSNRSAINQYV